MKSGLTDTTVVKLLETHASRRGVDALSSLALEQTLLGTERSVGDRGTNRARDMNAAE